MKLLRIMVLVLNCIVVFPATASRQQVVIREVHRVAIESSWRNFTDKATVELAGSLLYQGKPIEVNKLIKPGDAILIYLGYDQENELEFEGFVKTFGYGNPLKVECEDHSYLLKNRFINQVSLGANATLKQLLAAILPPGMPFESVDAPIGKYTTSNVTAGRILEDLRKDYGLVSYFRGRTLYVGKAYFANEEEEVVGVYRFGQNVKQDRIELEDLEHKPQVVVKSKVKGQKKAIEVKVGVDASKQRIIKVDGITDPAKLKEIAERHYELMTQKQFKGGITGFGYPRVQHSDVVRIDNGRFPGLDGKKFFVDDVKQDFSASGWSRTVELGKPLT
jgi:hypothetical protein